MKPKMFYDVFTTFYVYTYLSYVELSHIVLGRRKGCNTNMLCVYLPFLC